MENMHNFAVHIACTILFTQYASISIIGGAGDQQTSKLAFQTMSAAWMEWSHTIETIRTLTLHSCLFAKASAAAPIRVLWTTSGE